MDTISHSGTRVLEIFYMHQENNAPFMTKNVNFAFFPWRLLGHSKKNTDKFHMRRSDTRVIVSLPQISV